MKKRPSEGARPGRGATPARFLRDLASEDQDIAFDHAQRRRPTSPHALLLMAGSGIEGLLGRRYLRKLLERHDR